MQIERDDVPLPFDIGYVDSDILKYQCGFAAQKTVYHLYDAAGEHVDTFPNASDCKSHLEELEDFLGIDITKYRRESEVIVGEEQDAIDACDQLIKSLKKSCPCKEYVFYLSGKNNFRDKIATLYQYGHNRVNVAKPVWIESVVSHLKSKYAAKVVDGLEGDDLVSVGLVASTKKGKLAVHLGCDKDVKKGTCGWHYDFKANQFIYTTQEEALNFVYCQAVAGDSVDGFHGIPNVGMKKAEKIFANCTTEREMYEAGVEAYRKYFGSLHKYKSWDDKQMEKDPEGLFLENMHLAWILKEKDRFYKVPEV
jgi:hypothetical protein